MRKVQTGEPVTPEDEAHWQRTVETVAYNPYVAAVLQAEQALARLLAEINEIIAAELDLGTQTPTGPATARKGRAARRLLAAACGCRGIRSLIRALICARRKTPARRRRRS